jgi:hypothetical protein
MAGKKPWEKYAEGAGPWDMYTSIKEEERAVDDAMPGVMADVGTLTLQGGSHDFMDEIAGGVGTMVGDDYVTSRDAWREKVDGARERTGFIGDVIEGAAAAGTSTIIPGGPVIQGLTSAAVQGAGAAEEMEDVPMDMAKSVAVSGASQVAGKILKKTIEKPMDILARTSGARGIEFRNGEPLLDGEMLPDELVDRAKDPAGIAARLDKIGFFKKGDNVMDGSGKFVRNPYSEKDFLESRIEPQTIEGLLARTQQGVERLKQRNNQLVTGKRIPLDEVNRTLRDALNKFVPSGSGIDSRARAGENLIGEIVGDLQTRRHVKLDSKGRAYIDADNIETVKRYMQDKVAQTFSSGKAVGDITNEGVQARRVFSQKLDELVDRYGGAEYAKNNDLMRDLILTGKMLHNKASRDRGYGVEGPKLTAPKRHLMDFINDAVDNPRIGAARASMGKAAQTPAGKAAGEVMTRIPVEMINNQPMEGNWRQPQSVPNIPEQFIRTPLPRSTRELIQNKNFVLGKVAQMAPEMFEAIKDTFDHDPEMLSELAPVLAQKMPHLFARDKYDRFDGRVMTEQGKNRAMKDTLGDTSLNSIQQAEIISKLTKDGTYDR